MAAEGARAPALIGMKWGEVAAAQREVKHLERQAQQVIRARQQRRRGRAQPP